MVNKDNLGTQQSVPGCPCRPNTYTHLLSTDDGFSMEETRIPPPSLGWYGLLGPKMETHPARLPYPADSVWILLSPSSKHLTHCPIIGSPEYCNRCDYLLPPGASRLDWFPNLLTDCIYHLSLEAALPAAGQPSEAVFMLRRLPPPTHLNP